MKTCHYCRGRGTVRDWATVSTGQRSRCKPCQGIGILPDKGWFEFFCDRKRHLICIPYSRVWMDIMADALKIKRHWFHRDHYDIPLRRVGEITARCELVSSKEIVHIIRHGTRRKERAGQTAAR
jgi:hypothetical protein